MVDFLVYLNLYIKRSQIFICNLCNKTRIRLPSGAKKSVLGDARATIGIEEGGGNRIDKPVDCESHGNLNIKQPSSEKG